MCKAIEIETNSFPPGRADAITLWPFVFFKGKAKQDRALRAHEMYHWKQARNWGVLPWYLAYLVLLVIYGTGGRDHPMEKPAYKVQDEINRGMA